MRARVMLAPLALRCTRSLPTRRPPAPAPWAMAAHPSLMLRASHHRSRQASCHRLRTV